MVLFVHFFLKKLSLGNEGSLTKQEGDVVKFVSQKAPLTAVWKMDWNRINWKNLFKCMYIPHEGLEYWSEK